MPIVGRLDCGSTYVDHQGYWETVGFGLLSVYKSDWIRFGGKTNPRKLIKRDAFPSQTDFNFIAFKKVAIFLHSMLFSKFYESVISVSRENE